MDSSERHAPSGASGVGLPTHWCRPTVRAVRPRVDDGGRAAKATVGERVAVEADAFVDGHTSLWCELSFRPETSRKWTTVPMQKSYDDRWHANMVIEEPGSYRFVVRARVDEFATWCDDLQARVTAGQEVADELLGGAELIEAASGRAKGAERKVLTALAEALRGSPRGLESDVPDDLVDWAVPERPDDSLTLASVLFAPRVRALAGSLSDPASGASSETLMVEAETARARFSTWYELFPRSTSPVRGSHGTFADVQRRLEEIQRLGFDVLYLPPIHPIGLTARKGRDGTSPALPEDPGSPWAIGAAEGGHTAIHPLLGTLDEFRALVHDAASRGIDIAIDLAFQASPDHPWVTEHPEWFRHRHDGSIRYAENPPKRYEDIFPFDFECADWQGLWAALRDVVRFWVDQGVSVFRVDNPHTKPFAFWEWLLRSIRAEFPETIFLSEAFTRPRVMEHLARIGFTQSYTYFTWRRTKWELESYLNQLCRSEVADYFRPNLWPNTPDILTEELQEGGRAAFIARLVLAATLSASYGIYGPPFELQEHVPREPGSEEYLHSEKYEVRWWDLDDPGSLAPLVALVNRIRREHEALQFNDSLHFHPTDNEDLIAYTKSRAVPGGRDVVLAIVNLDHHYVQSGWVTLNLEALGLVAGRSFAAHDLLTGAQYVWEGATNFVKLDPLDVPCHIFSLEQTAEPAERARP
jgi:starch synthase (maltosyl-transferring)